ncbi:MAG TPA: hypothetical protein VJL29_13315, partial [Thermoguttaceae bacterium]|nr:hypothetical protein [Thermoguttaceae bacterium]
GAVASEKTPLLQYFQATRLNTPEAWRAVVDFAPTDEYLSRRAKQQLIRLYLADGNYDAALPLCDELVALDSKEAELRAFGQAGRAVALSGKGLFTDSAQAIAAFQSLSDELHDNALRERLKAAEQKNNQSLNPKESPSPPGEG